MIAQTTQTEKNMKNPIVAKFLENGKMEVQGGIIDTSWELGEKIHAALTEQKVKVKYHFDKENGTLVFTKVLGRDENDDFYNEQNGNLEARKEVAKAIIVKVLLEEF